MNLGNMKSGLKSMVRVCSNTSFSSQTNYIFESIQTRSKLYSSWTQLNRLPTRNVKTYKSPFYTTRSDRCFSSNSSQTKTGSNSQQLKKPEFPWKLALGTSSICGLVAAYVIYEQDRISKSKIAKVETSTIGKPKIGGPWNLTDQDGNALSSSDLHGKYQLIYFGFSYCPDICPQELEKMALVIEELDKKYGEIVQPVFITVDPKRDNPKQLKEYCKEFHPRLIGVTGTEEEIKPVTKLFRVYYNAGVTTAENDYLIDHSIIQYFMGKNGTFKDFFGKNLSASEMIQKISSYIDQDNLSKLNKGKVEDA